MKRDWTLTPEAFERLLAFLDSDRQHAGRIYENIRQKLVKMFQWRGVASPEDFADRTIDRVARRLAEGQPVRADNPYLYFHGVALNVLREASREPRLEALSEVRAPGLEDGREREHVCLDECLAGLLPESRRLVLEYHAQEGRAKIEARVRLARALDIPLNALRIRAYRIRADLYQCIEGCLSREMESSLKH